MAQKSHQQLTPKMHDTVRGQEVMGSWGEMTASSGRAGGHRWRAWAGRGLHGASGGGPHLLHHTCEISVMLLQTWLPGLMPCCHRAQKQQSQLRVAGTQAVRKPSWLSDPSRANTASSPQPVTIEGTAKYLRGKGYLGEGEWYRDWIFILEALSLTLNPRPSKCIKEHKLRSKICTTILRTSQRC